MPMPWTYRHAEKEWKSLVADAREEMSLTSDNMTYTAIQAMFQVVRRRLTAQQGLDFAAVLPAIPRAIFVEGWKLEPPLPFGPREELVAEVQAFRPHHNLTPGTVLESVSRALRRHMDQRDLDRVLAGLPDEATAYWAPLCDPQILQQRVI